MVTGKKNKWSKLTTYQSGRLLSYSFFGLIAGWFGAQANILTPLPILQVLSGVLLILMGLYLSRLWMAISYIEKAGKLIWDRIRPLSRQFLPVVTAKQAFSLGMLWGWLPCGLVYTSISYALTTADPVKSALFMFVFGLGTLPATLTAGSAGLNLKHYLNRPGIRMFIAILFIAFGVYALYSLFQLDPMTHHHH